MKKALLAMVVLAGTGVGVYRWKGDSAPAPKHQEDLLTDRLWVDHIPRGERDVFQIFAARTEEPIVILQSTSRWKGEFEMFKYEAHGDEMRIFYPQTRSSEKVRAKATECNRDGMDYCLELEGSNHGVKKYYSRDGWEIGNQRDIDALAKKLAN
jgi:hypothetical protein